MSHSGLRKEKKTVRGKSGTVLRSYWVKSQPTKVRSRDGRNLAKSMGRLGQSIGRWGGSSAGMAYGRHKGGAIGGLAGAVAGYKTGEHLGRHAGSMAGYLVGRKVDQRTAGAMAHGVQLAAYAVDAAHAFARAKALSDRFR